MRCEVLCCVESEFSGELSLLFPLKQLCGCAEFATVLLMKSFSFKRALTPDYEVSLISKGDGET